MVRTIFTLILAAGFISTSWSQSRSTYELAVSKDGTSVSVQWRSIEGLNIEYYEVYKLNSDDGWEVLETIEHQDHIESYQILDSAPNEGSNSYLLRALEITGMPHFSGIEHFYYEAPEFEVLVYPNPASDWVVINSEEIGASFNAELVNRYGVSVLKAKSSKGSILFDTSNVIEGIYYIRINNGQMKYNRPVVINHR